VLLLLLYCWSRPCCCCPCCQPLADGLVLLPVGSLTLSTTVPGGQQTAEVGAFRTADCQHTMTACYIDVKPHYPLQPCMLDCSEQRPHQIMLRLPTKASYAFKASVMASQLGHKQESSGTTASAVTRLWHNNKTVSTVTVTLVA